MPTSNNLRSMGGAGVHQSNAHIKQGGAFSQKQTEAKRSRRKKTFVEKKKCWKERKGSGKSSMKAVGDVVDETSEFL